MSEVCDISDGAFVSAVQAVTPEVPALYSPSRVLRRTYPEAVRDALRAELELSAADDQGETERALNKAEIYTVVAAGAAAMAPHLLEGEAAEAKYRHEQDIVASKLMLLTDCVGLAFNNSFDHTIARQEWLRVADRRIHPILRDHLLDRGRPLAGPTLRNVLSGGSTPRTALELAGLAAKLNPVQNTEYDCRSAVAKNERLAHRAQTMHDLAYLGVSQAGLNVGLFDPPMFGNYAGTQPLNELVGTLNTVNRSDRELTIFKRSDSANWAASFPADASRNQGPTLKCPVRHARLEGAAESVLETALHATINFGVKHDKL